VTRKASDALRHVSDFLTSILILSSGRLCSLMRMSACFFKGKNRKKSQWRWSMRPKNHRTKSQNLLA